MAAEKLKKSKKQAAEAAEAGQAEVAAKKAKKSDKEKKEKKRAAGSDDEGEVKKKKAKKAAQGGSAAKAVDKAAGQADDAHAGEGFADGKPKADPELSLDKFEISPSVKSLLVRRKDEGHARAVQDQSLHGGNMLGSATSFRKCANRSAAVTLYPTRPGPSVFLCSQLLIFFHSPMHPVLPPQRAQGIQSLFAIQAQTLPHGLAGFDVVGRARTGCGKTLAFSLPIVERLLKDKAGGQFQVGQGMGRPPSCIVMAPTRELAKQVCGAGERDNREDD